MCMISVFPLKIYNNYFHEFLEQAYLGDHLKGNLKEINKVLFEKYNTKEYGDFDILYQACINGYNKSSNSVEPKSNLGHLIFETISFKEKFLPIVPSLRINDMTISVIFNF